MTYKLNIIQMVRSMPKVLSWKTSFACISHASHSTRQVVGATSGARDAYYFSGTPGLTFFRKGPHCLNKFILLYMQVQGAILTFLFVLSIHICPYLCLSFMFSWSLPIVCVVFPSLHVLCRSFLMGGRF